MPSAPPADHLGHYSASKDHTISVSAATYARMRAAARERRCTLAELVRRACADIVERP